MSLALGFIMIIVGLAVASQVWREVENRKGDDDE
jgi:hypothetical protein